jgi:hypothetical protein
MDPRFDAMGMKQTETLGGRAGLAWLVQLEPQHFREPSKSLSVVRIARSCRKLTAHIRKSVFDPWSPFARHRLKQAAASS